ncbi:serine/threonine-protein kinase [Actinomadura sp. HBU206391]|uniref:serine/threonine-protein kinase n=1 Tax=Actinomadura sp. HBU206391 TaxID=2731692 RepID=UPI00164FD913|nr:serine/threonine-protein kinase [Actinomadura sp. HBU206391]MBC6461126.1 serine/threonine protein kinase [Actinomadura sp. HBU206391]
MAAVSLEPGDPRKLGGFRLIGRLGEGGQGVVYLGHAPGGERVAVKVLKADADPAARGRLARELAACERVAPFCTARVIHSSTEETRPYVVSEYVDGPSLQERVEREGPLRGGELDRLVVGTATALTAIHGAGVLHRDLKPANVLLGPDGPRVVDFGIARPIESGTITTNLVGTPAYLAPEQLNGEPPSPATDVFAWASTMVFAATGRPTFGDDTIAAVLNRIAHAVPDLTGVPPRLRGLLAACLAKNPAERPRARALLMRLVDPSAAVGAEERPDVDLTLTVAANRALAGRDVAEWTSVLPLRDRVRMRGRTLAMVGAGAAALLLLAGAGYLSLARGGGAAPAGGWSATPEVSGPPATPSPEGPPEGTIPEAFGGAWRGHASERDGEVETRGVPVVIMMRPGDRGGHLELPEDQCQGELDLVNSGGEELTFRLGFRSGDCLDGTVTLARRGEHELGYRWQERGGRGTAEATLHRAG